MSNIKKSLLSALIPLVLGACSVDVTYPIPTLSKEKAKELKSKVISSYDYQGCSEPGVNCMHRKGLEILAYSKNGVLSQDDCRLFCDLMDARWFEGGYYSQPPNHPYFRIATRDDYFGMLLAAYKCKPLLQCASNYLHGLYTKMVDGKGLVLENDLWSPIHKIVFKRAHLGKIEYNFLDMIAFYAQVKPLKNDSDRLLWYMQSIITRENGPTYWFKRSYKHLTDHHPSNRVVRDYLNRHNGHDLAQLLQNVF